MVNLNNSHERLHNYLGYFSAFLLFSAVACLIFNSKLSLAYVFAGTAGITLVAMLLGWYLR